MANRAEHEGGVSLAFSFEYQIAPNIYLLRPR
jgi:hypothetical protein